MDLQKSNTRNFLVKPAAAAGIAATAAYMWRQGAPVEVPGLGVYPYPVVVAGSMFIASEVVGLIEKYALKEVPVINMFEAPAKAALNIGAVAGTALAIDKLLVPGLIDQKPLPEYLAFAALAEIGATYLADDLVIPMWNKWMPSNAIGY